MKIVIICVQENSSLGWFEEIGVTEISEFGNFPLEGSWEFFTSTKIFYGRMHGYRQADGHDWSASVIGFIVRCSLITQILAVSGRRCGVLWVNDASRLVPDAHGGHVTGRWKEVFFHHSNEPIQSIELFIVIFCWHNFVLIIKLFSFCSINNLHVLKLHICEGGVAISHSRNHLFLDENIRKVLKQGFSSFFLWGCVPDHYIKPTPSLWSIQHAFVQWTPNGNDVLI